MEVLQHLTMAAAYAVDGDRAGLDMDSEDRLIPGGGHVSSTGDSWC